MGTMNREDYEAAMAALEEITEILGWNARARVAVQYGVIENTLKKYAPEKTESEKIQEKISEYEERIFEIKMKDRMEQYDWATIKSYDESIAELKERLSNAKE